MKHTTILELGLLALYCLLNAAVLTGLWHILHVGILPSRALRDIFIKTAYAIAIVWALIALTGRMFCWTASLAHCLACMCPVTSGILPGAVSLPGVALFLVAVIFVQLTLIAIPKGLSRMLFVLTVTASNLAAVLIKLGLHAILF